jgi:hypothetical protein
LQNDAVLAGTGVLASLTATGSATVAPSTATAETGIGRLTVTNSFTLNAGTRLQLELGKATAGAQPVATDFDSIVIGTGGTATLNNASLDLRLNTGVQEGDIFTVLLNSGSSAIGGEFAGVANGGYVMVNAQPFVLSYFDDPSTTAVLEFSGGGSVSLLAVPEPTTGASLIAAVASLLGLQRFRRRRS